MGGRGCAFVRVRARSRRRTREGNARGARGEESPEREGAARRRAATRTRLTNARANRPQTPTVPIPGGEGGGVNYPAWATTEPALVPVAINWTQGGNSVEVEGSFDNWQSRQTLHRSGNREFAIVDRKSVGEERV